jgi:hypothetical protein
MIIKSKRLRWEGHVVCMKDGTYKYFIGKPEGKSTRRT